MYLVAMFVIENMVLRYYVGEIIIIGPAHSGPAGPAVTPMS